MSWVRRLRSVFVWTAANEAPHGFIAAVVSLWTVAFMSVLVYETTDRMFQDISQITAAAAAAYATLLGTGLAGAWAFFRWARGAENAPYEVSAKSLPVDQYADSYVPRGRF